MLLDANDFIKHCEQNNYPNEAFVSLMDNITEDTGRFVESIKNGYTHYFAYNRENDQLSICCIRKNGLEQMINDGFLVAEAYSILKKFSH